MPPAAPGAHPVVLALALAALPLAALPLAGVGAQGPGQPPAPLAARAPSPVAPLERRPVPPPAARLRTGADSALVGELRLPPGRGPFPVAILVHGGCWLTRFADDRHLRPLAESLRLDEGLATWSVRYRRADELGGGWPGTFQDLAAAADSVRALARRFPLDTTRVVVVGHSAGASLGPWLAARPFLPADDPTAALVRGAAPLRVHGVVAIDGPVDLAAARPLGPPVCGEPVLERLLGAAPAAEPARWRMASPAAWLAAAPRTGPGAVRQAVVVGGLDRMAGRRFPAAALPAHAGRAGAAVFVADTTDHFSMLDPARPPFQATRDAVRHALGRPPLGTEGADRAALADAYRTFAAGMHARSLDAAVERLAPDFEHHARDGRGAMRVTSRASFVAGLGGMFPALDSLLAFTIDVTEIRVRGDSAEVAYREHVDARWRSREPGAAAVRDSATGWWRDRWVRTPAGWRAVRFEEVAPPAAARDTQGRP